MSTSINRVVILGNLTRDPELRANPGGTSVCQLRLAVSERVKDAGTGQWHDRASYFDVAVFGVHGERCGQLLTKGRQVAVEGRLRWRERQTLDGKRREAVSVVADAVQFLGAGPGAASVSAGRPAAPDAPTVVGASGDDLPF